MPESFDRLKAQKDAIAERTADKALRIALTPIYDRLAAINDHIEVGDDGYARLGSLNDRDMLQALCDELGARTRFSEADVAEAKRLLAKGVQD